MALDYLEIDTEQLASDTGKLREDISSAKLCLQEMIAELDELNTYWKGTANQAFRITVASDCNMMMELLSEMDKLAEHCDYSQKEYVKCENEVMEEIRKIVI